MHSISGIFRQALLMTALVLLSVLQETGAVYFYRYTYYRSYRYTSYSSYRYYSSRIYVGYYSYHSPVGSIIGSVISSLVVIGFLVGLIVCCIRKRRQAAAAARNRATVPMTVGGTTVISTVSPGGYPAAPAGGPPYDYSKQGGYPGVAPPPYPAAADPAVGYAGGAAGYQDNAGYAGYQNGQQAPPYPNPTAADPQMPPPLPVTGAEQQRF